MPSRRCKLYLLPNVLLERKRDDGVLAKLSLGCSRVLAGIATLDELTCSKVDEKQISELTFGYPIVTLLNDSIVRLAMKAGIQFHLRIKILTCHHSNEVQS